MNSQLPLRFQLRLEPAPLAPGETPELEAASLRTLRLAVEKQPQEPDYHFILGEALVRGGRYAQALEPLREAVSLNGDHLEYRRLLGEAAFLSGQYDEARSAFGEALLLLDDSAELHNLLGVTLAAQGREAEALLSLQEARVRAPNCSPILSNMGVALWRLGRAESALERLREAVQRGGSVESHWNLAVAAAASGHDEEAEGALRRVTERAPKDAMSHALRGEVLSRLGRLPEAGREFQAALCINPRCLDSLSSAREAYEGMQVAAIRVSGPTTYPIWVRALDLVLAAPRAVHHITGVFGSVVILLLCIGIAFSSVRAGGPFVAHFFLKDRTAGIARSALVGHDDELRELLTRAVHDSGLDHYVKPEDFAISTHGDLRRIQCNYEQPVDLLPGWRRVFHFAIDVEEPFIGDAGRP